MYGHSRTPVCAIAVYAYAATSAPPAIATRPPHLSVPPPLADASACLPHHTSVAVLCPACYHTTSTTDTSRPQSPGAYIVPRLLRSHKRADSSYPSDTIVNYCQLSTAYFCLFLHNSQQTGQNCRERRLNLVCHQDTVIPVSFRRTAVLIELPTRYIM